MQEFKGYIHSKEGIKDALRRNKMMGNRSIGLPAKDISPTDSFSEFLKVYVFDQLGMTPQQLLSNLETQYYAEQDFRQRRQRNIDFTRGRHFGEMVWDDQVKKHVTQWDYLQRRNIPPLTYNVISKLERSLVGQFREINTGNIVKCESKDQRGQELANVLTECLNRIKNHNKAKQKDAKNMKEMLQSGRPIFKVMWGSKNNMTKKDVRFRVINTSKFIMNPGVTDDDFANLHTGCEIHDTDIDSIIGMFANLDYERGIEIKEQYVKYQGNQVQQSQYSSQSFDGSQLQNQTFQNQGVGSGSYRYFEVWNKISAWEAATYDPLELPGNNFKVHKWRDPQIVKKEIDALNEERRINSEGDVNLDDIFIQFSTDFRSRFFVSYITPWGHLLDVKESPYKNGMMPYVMPSPGINGEIFGLIEEIIPAQLSLDRQILLADSIVANASKGVWLIPSEAVPDDMTKKEYLSEIKKADGAVIVQMKEGFSAAEVMPKQVYAASSNVGNQVHQMIDLYSNLVDEISGNYGAAQGKGGAGAAKTATGYALESQNSGLNVRDMFETYLDTLLQRDELILMFIEEGYTKADYLKITGKEIDTKEFKAFEFSIEQSKGTNSPAHRLALEQELLQLVYNQLMPFEVFLDISNNPVMIQAKQKLQEFNKNQAMQQQQIQGDGITGQAPQMTGAENQAPQMTGAENQGPSAEKLAENQMKRVQNIG